jgi:outer membrane lipoprotein SlyB
LQHPVALLTDAGSSVAARDALNAASTLCGEVGTQTQIYGLHMRIKALMLTLATVAIATSAQAEAAGCLKGAAVGAVGGHFVGKGHAVLGATGGCLVGRHMADRKAKEDAIARAQTQHDEQIRQSTH